MSRAASASNINAFDGRKDRQFGHFNEPRITRTKQMAFVCARVRECVLATTDVHTKTYFLIGSDVPLTRF